MLLCISHRLNEGGESGHIFGYELAVVGPSHAVGCCCSLDLFLKCFPVICAVFSDVLMSLLM